MSAATMLKLPASVRMDDTPALWKRLEPGLRAEAAQVRSAAGQQVEISLAELQAFDSAVLTLLLSAARLCKAEGVKLVLHEVPAKLRELARVYGVAELLWPEAATAQLV